jgi:hypothetical protein
VVGNTRRRLSFEGSHQRWGSRHVNARPPSGCGFVDGTKKPRPQLHRSDTTARQFIDASLNPLETRKRRKEEAHPISTPATKPPLRLFCSAAPVSLTLERPLPIKVYPTGSFDESTDLLDQGMNSLLLAALVFDPEDVLAEARKLAECKRSRLMLLRQTEAWISPRRSVLWSARSSIIFQRRWGLDLCGARCARSEELGSLARWAPGIALETRQLIQNFQNG